MISSRFIQIAFVLTAVTFAGCAPTATPTPLPPTPDAQATAAKIAADASASLTASAPTLTPVPTQTPVPTVTATRLPTLTPTALPETSEVFRDDFASDCLYESDNDSRTMKCENGEYTILNKAANRIWWSYLGPEDPDTITEFDVRKIAGDDNMDYGLAFRVSSDASRYYYFSVVPGAAEYALLYHADQKWNDLISYTHSDAIKAGDATNHLKVVAQRQQFVFYVNGQLLGSITDTAEASGRLGLVMGSIDPNGKAAFDNVVVTKINRPLDLPAAQARPPTPTARPEIPPGMGAIIVTDFCGFDVNIDVAGQFHTIPINGSIVIFVAPGEHPVSATAGGKRLGCGGGGCSVVVAEGKYTPYPYCALPAE